MSEIPKVRPIRSLPRVRKLWGGEIILANNSHYCGKLLILKAGAQGSLHKHGVKHETMLVLNGKVELEVSRDKDPKHLEMLELGVNDSIVLPPGVWHRFRSVAPTSVIAEFSMPHSDEDVERVEESRVL